MTNKEILDNTKWSFSTLHMYEECPYSFYCKKLDDEKIGIGNFYAEAGIFAHEISADLFSSKITLDEAIDTWINTYNDRICSDIKESTKEKKYYEMIDYLSSLDLSRMEKYEVLEIENRSEWTLGKYKMVGFIDMLIRDISTQEIILIDHKSAGKFLKKDGTPLKNQASSFEAYKKQMHLYCMPIFEKYGDFPSKIVWNHFFAQEVTCIPFVEEEYVAAQKWAKDTIKKIHKDKVFKAHCFNEEVYKDNYVKCRYLCDYREDCEYLS